MLDTIADVTFGAAFVLVPFVALLLLRYAGISIRTFTLPSFFIIFYLVFAYAGILPLYFGWDAYSLSIGVHDKAVILAMFLYASMSLITIIGGFIFAYHVVGLRAGRGKPRVFIGGNSEQRIFMVCLFLLCCVVLLRYIQQLESIALLEVLAGDISGAAVARSEMGNNFAGKYWRYSLFFRHLLDFCVIFFLADYLMRRRAIAGLLLGASFLAAAFSATMAVEKAPLIKLLIMLYLTYVLAKGGRYWQPAAKYVAAVGIGILGVFYVYFMGVSDFAAALPRISQRVFTGQVSSSYFYLDRFPRDRDYLLGASLPNPGGLLPFESVPLTVEISEVMTPKDFAAGIVGSSPTVFWAEMHANFGPTGVAVSSFLVGIGLYTVYHLLALLPFSAPVIAATVFLAMHYRALTETSLSSYLFDVTLIAIAAATCMVLLLNKKHLSALLAPPRTAVSETAVYPVLSPIKSPMSQRDGST